MDKVMKSVTSDLEFKRYKDYPDTLVNMHTYRVQKDGKTLVHITSESRLFEDCTLDHYSEIIGIDREGMKLIYCGYSIQINVLRK